MSLHLDTKLQRMKWINKINHFCRVVFRKMCQLLHGKYHYNCLVVILTVTLVMLIVITKIKK
jgi:hypothetical protein